MSWTETDFEDWFKAHLLLDAKNLVLVTGFRAIHHDVDLLCLDEDACLVLIEVKNERSSRKVLGQVLEYLADLSSVSNAEELCDYCGVDPSTVKERFRQEFEKELDGLSIDKRQVCVVGPSVDHSCAACLDFLSSSALQIPFSFYVATARRNVQNELDFDLRRHCTSTFVSARRLQTGELVTKPIHSGNEHRIFYVLQNGKKCIAWKAGTIKNGRVVPLTSHRHAIIRLSGRVQRIDQVPEIDTTRNGRVVDLGRGVYGKIIGEVGGYVVFARFNELGFRSIKAMSRGDFTHSELNVSLPDWTDIHDLLERKIPDNDDL